MENDFAIKLWDDVNGARLVGHEKSARQGEGGLTSRSRAGAVDLYFWWAVYTDFRSSKPSGGEFPYIFSFVAEGSVEGFVEAFKKATDVSVPSVYSKPIVSGAEKATFFTINVVAERTRGQDVNEDSLSKRLREVMTCSALTRVQLGFPRGRFEGDVGPSDQSKPPWTPESPVPTDEKREARVVLGVIDDGAAFAHASFRQGGQAETRFSLIWNQSRELKAYRSEWWNLPDGNMRDGGWYGMVLPQERMNKLMAVSTELGEVGELKCYARLVDRTLPSRVLESRDSHGAAVSIAMGGSLDAASVLVADPDHAELRRSKVLTDPAASAPIIFVNLPHELVAISSGRWMPIAVLDGVRFIADEARRRFGKTNVASVPTVINVSCGASAGSHKGESLIESALAELLRADANLAITVAAGNSRLAESHAECQVDPQSEGQLVVRIPPAKKFETYIEIWPEWQANSDAQTEPEVAEIEFTVTAPDGRTMGPVTAGGNGALLYDKNKRVIAGINVTENAVQAKNRPMALLVVAATAPHATYNHAPHGDWVIVCRNNARAVRLRVPAWIERDEIVFGVRQPQSARFVENEFDYAKSPTQWTDAAYRTVKRTSTASNLANTRGAFAVAAGMGGKQTGYVSPYSGAGAAQEENDRPLLMARADRSAAQPGIPVFGAYRSVRYHMNGTSIAAPIAARWVANMMANANCDTPHISALAQYSAPRVHRHLGTVAAGEGRLFIDASDPPQELCLGPQR